MPDLLLRNVFEAADAAFDEVTLDGAFLWDKADPAADFADLLVFLLLKTFEAALAARLLVTSVLRTIINTSNHTRNKLHVTIAVAAIEI